MELYEKVYNQDKSFSFGKNWQNFLEVLNDEKIEEAEKSLLEFLGGKDNIEHKTFVDIGCGSGLFSLAAFRLGASRVVSVDIDDFSIHCVTELRERYAKTSNNWEIQKGSALDAVFMGSLGTFDIVYSWGVLHHTGSMYTALSNVDLLAHQNSYLYIALYNKFTRSFRGGTSATWTQIKKVYNSVPEFLKSFMRGVYGFYMVSMMLLRLQNPLRIISSYKSYRGMSWYHDLVDWIGGYPYEASSVDEIVRFYGERNWQSEKVSAVNGLGCNEFLFIKR